MGKDGPGGRAPEGDLTATGDRPRFYGRRKGRPLRKGRERLIEEALPRLSIPDPAGGSLRPEDAFGRAYAGFWLEIGFGGGEHLAWQAGENPNIGLIGAEPFLAGVASCLGHIERAGLENVRVHADDARPLLAALPEASIDRVFVLHPDPWRKRRHWERRLIGPDGLDAIARVLKPGGELRASTDHAGYQVWMLRHLQAHPRFAWQATCADDWRRRPADWPETRYEAKAKREGRIPVYLSYRRV